MEYIDNNELLIGIRNMTYTELVSKIANNEESAEIGLSIFGGSFDDDILFGDDALIALNHKVYLDEIESRD